MILKQVGSLTVNRFVHTFLKEICVLIIQSLTSKRSKEGTNIQNIKLSCLCMSSIYFTQLGDGVELYLIILIHTAQIL